MPITQTPQSGHEKLCRTHRASFQSLISSSLCPIALPCGAPACQSMASDELGPVPPCFGDYSGYSMLF